MRYLPLAYSSFVLAWFLTNLIAQDSYWLLVGLDKFANYFLFPSLLILLLSLLSRSTKIIAAAMQHRLAYIVLRTPQGLTTTLSSLTSRSSVPDLY